MSESERNRTKLFVRATRLRVNKRQGKGFVRFLVSDVAIQLWLPRVMDHRYSR